MAKWGQARIEVLASQNSIREELRRGMPVQRVFDELAAQKLVTVSYNSFRLQLRKMDLLRKQSANQNEIVNERENSTRSKPKNHQPEKFVFEPADDLSFYSDLDDQE